jgi:trimethylamine--corrinoid protein Co-methyltransferase
MPDLLDNNSYEQWLAEGAHDAAARATAKAREQLARWDDHAPTLDPAVDEALRAFISKREAELPDTVG